MKIKTKLFLKSFLLSFLLFALISSIIITSIYIEKISLKPLERESNILIGIIHEEQVISLAVLNFDPENSEMGFLPIPDNTLVSNNLILQDMYHKNGINNLVYRIENMIGASIDRYLLLSADAVREIINNVGKVNYYIPYKFIHGGTEHSGQSIMSGDIAYSMFTYNEYNLKEVSVSNMASSFLQSFLSNHANSTNIAKLKISFNSNNVLKLIKTDLNYEEISAYCDYLTNYSSLSHKFYNLKGSYQTTSMSKYFTPDELNTTKNIFE